VQVCPAAGGAGVQALVRHNGGFPLFWAGFRKPYDNGTKKEKNMVVNNLLVRLKERDSKEIEKVKNLMLSMSGKIPVLLDIQVQTDVKAGESPYDLMLIATFNSLEDKQAYLDHPVHLDVAKYVQNAMESGASLCYEV
jgi:hypothetical protein